MILSECMRTMPFVNKPPTAGSSPLCVELDECNNVAACKSDRYRVNWVDIMGTREGIECIRVGIVKMRCFLFPLFVADH